MIGHTISTDHDHQVDALWEAVRRGNLVDAEQLLKSGADALRWHRFDIADLHVHPGQANRNSLPKGPTKPTKKYHGSMVAAAVMRGDINMVKLLVETGNAPLCGDRSYYTFKAGLRKVDFEGPPTFAVFGAAPKKQVPIIKDLVSLRADLLEKGKLEDKDNNTLLWNAAYSGSNELVKYLLDHCKEQQLEEVCAHQDTGTITHTPLHIAALSGHVTVVRTLIQANAKLTRENEDEMTPLTDAIDQDHAQVVRMLVRNQADVLSDHAIDWLFHKRNNVVTIEAAAQAMRRAMLDDPVAFQTDYLRIGTGMKPNLKAEHVVKFINTPGDATMHIISLLFQKRSLKYSTKGKTKDNTTVYSRRNYNTAHIPENAKFNAATGPDVAYWDNQFEKSGLEIGKYTPREASFFKSLLPHQDYHWHLFPHLKQNAAPMQVPIEIYQCVLSGIHRNPDVLFAIKEQEDEDVFQALGIQAILKLGWQKVWWRYTGHLINSILIVVVLLFTTTAINTSTGGGFTVWARVRVLVMSFLWGKDVEQEIAQFIGYWILGKLEAYLLDIWNVIDFVRLVLTGVVVSYLWGDESQQRDSLPFRILLAIVVFFRWMRVLNGLKGYEFAGKDMLPIMRAFGNVLPFFSVVACPLLGFTHAYFCFGVYGGDFFLTFSIIYRLGFLGDFDMDEMEDVNAAYEAQNNTVFEPLEPDKGRWWLILRFFLICCSLILTLAMMNIFIGVLGESYNTAREKSEEIFWKNRAQIVFDEQAQLLTEHRVAEKLRTICGCCMCGNSSSQPGSPGPGSPGGTIHSPSSPLKPRGSILHVESDISLERAHDPNVWDYVWYCCKAEGVPGASETHSNPTEHSSSPATDKFLDEIRDQLQSHTLGLQAIYKSSRSRKAAPQRLLRSKSKRRTRRLAARDDIFSSREDNPASRSQLKLGDSSMALMGCDTEALLAYDNSLSPAKRDSFGWTEVGTAETSQSVNPSAFKASDKSPTNDKAGAFNDGERSGALAHTSAGVPAERVPLIAEVPLTNLHLSSRNASPEGQKVQDASKAPTPKSVAQAQEVSKYAGQIRIHKKKKPDSQRINALPMLDPKADDVRRAERKNVFVPLAPAEDYVSPLISPGAPPLAAPADFPSSRWSSPLVPLDARGWPPEELERWRS